MRLHVKDTYASNKYFNYYILYLFKLYCILPSIVQYLNNHPFALCHNVCNRFPPSYPQDYAVIWWINIACASAIILELTEPSNHILGYIV